jgi:hypothetical protein
MTRFINNLPEWHVSDLISLLIDGRKSMDSACASGENSAILTHRQMDFIEVLIKKKGGQVPTFEEIFHVEEDWVVLEITTDLFDDERKNRTIRNFKSRQEAKDYLQGFKEFIGVSHGEEAVLNIKHYIKPMNPYRG